jgi:hypothetical protein
MKRALIVTLALLLLASFFPAVGQAETLLTSGDYRYRVLGDGTAEIVRYTGPAEYLELPDKLDGLAVTSIGNAAISYCENLKGITIPDSIASIGEAAFACCNHLEGIVIPDTVTSVGYNPFESCGSLSQVTVGPDHPTLATIDGVLFSKEDKRLIWYPLTKEDTVYEIPQGTLIIGGGAFKGCNRLSGITIPDSVTSIGLFAFVMCNHLSGITIPDSVTSIDSYAFFGCENLSSITIPDSVASIGKNALYECKSLKEVIVAPNSYAQQYCEDNGLPFVFQENTD